MGKSIGVSDALFKRIDKLARDASISRMDVTDRLLTWALERVTVETRTELVFHANTEEIGVPPFWPGVKVKEQDAKK